MEYLRMDFRSRYDSRRRLVIIVACALLAISIGLLVLGFLPVAEVQGKVIRVSDPQTYGSGHISPDGRGGFIIFPSCKIQVMESDETVRTFTTFDMMVCEHQPGENISLEVTLAKIAYLAE